MEFAKKWPERANDQNTRRGRRKILRRIGNATHEVAVAENASWVDAVAEESEIAWRRQDRLHRSAERFHDPAQIAIRRWLGKSKDDAPVRTALDRQALVADSVFFRPGVEQSFVDFQIFNRPGLESRVPRPDVAELPLVDEPHLEQRTGRGMVAVFPEDILEVVSQDITLVDQQILDGACEFAEFRASRKNMFRLGPGERLLQEPVPCIDESRPECGAHVDEIRHRIARNREQPLLPAINIRDMINLLPKPVAKQCGVHENQLPEQTTGLEERRHVDGIGQRRLADSEIREHVSNRAIASGVDCVNEWRTAITHERVLCREAAFPTGVLPTLESRADDPARFLANGLHEAPREILPDCHPLGDFFLRNDASLGIPLGDLALDRIFNKTRPESPRGEVHADEIILREAALGKRQAAVLLA